MLPELGCPGQGTRQAVWTRGGIHPAVWAGAHQNLGDGGAQHDLLYSEREGCKDEEGQPEEQVDVPGDVSGERQLGACHLKSFVVDLQQQSTEADWALEACFAAPNNESIICPKANLQLHVLEGSSASLCNLSSMHSALLQRQLGLHCMV